jgi:hypothetical protein
MTMTRRDPNASHSEFAGHSTLRKRARPSGEKNLLQMNRFRCFLRYGKGLVVVKNPLHIIPPILFCGRTSQ